MKKLICIFALLSSACSVMPKTHSDKIDNDVVVVPKNSSPEGLADKAKQNYLECVNTQAEKYALESKEDVGNVAEAAAGTCEAKFKEFEHLYTESLSNIFTRGSREVKYQALEVTRDVRFNAVLAAKGRAMEARAKRSPSANQN